MMLRFDHEVVAPGLHRFVFPSQSRSGVAHELMLDLHEAGAARLSCLCEAALFGKLCRHKRFVILAFATGGRRGPKAWRWSRARGVRPRSGASRRNP